MTIAALTSSSGDPLCRGTRSIRRLASAEAATKNATAITISTSGKATIRRASDGGVQLRGGCVAGSSDMAGPPSLLLSAKPGVPA